MPLAAIKRPNSKLQVLLSSPATYATTLLTIFVDLFGYDSDDKNALRKAFDWHPSTKRMELEQEIGIEMAPENGDKLNTAIDIVTSDSFFQREDVFVNYCNVLSGSRLSIGTFDPADADECAWGIVEGLLIGQPEEDEPFAEPILWYLGHVLDKEGIKNPPDVLRIAKRDKKPDFGDMSLDNPGMFKAEFTMQQDEARDIEKMLRTKLVELLHELEQTPLKNGNTEDLRQRVGQGLGGMKSRDKWEPLA